MPNSDKPEIPKTKAELMLEEYIRRRDAGEFDEPPTWADLEGLDPKSIKYHLLRCELDEEYARESRRKFHRQSHGARAMEYRLRHGAYPLP